jgi:hypothetical protein
MLHPTAGLQSLPPGRLEPKNTYSHFFMSVPSHADPAIFFTYPDLTFKFDQDLDPTIKKVKSSVLSLPVRHRSWCLGLNNILIEVSLVKSSKKLIGINPNSPQ